MVTCIQNNEDSHLYQSSCTGCMVVAYYWFENSDLHEEFRGYFTRDSALFFWNAHLSNIFKGLS